MKIYVSPECSYDLWRTCDTETIEELRRVIETLRSLLAKEQAENDRMKSREMRFEAALLRIRNLDDLDCAAAKAAVEMAEKALKDG